MTLFEGLDHVAIVVADTDAALPFYRDQLGFPVVASEIVNDPPVRLTHLDMGNAHLQLVQPISDAHPLHSVVAEQGEILHHICFKVGSITHTLAALPQHGLQARGNTPHAGIQGKAAAFLSTDSTRGILMEITGAH